MKTEHRGPLPEDLPVVVCYDCQIGLVLRDTMDGEVFLPEGQILLRSPDRTAITPHWKGCKSAC